LGLTLTFLPSSTVIVVLEESKQVASRHETSSSSFRYVIIYNEVVDAVHNLDSSRTGPKQRFVDVLMQEEAFSEENLRTLYQSISKRFPEPQHLSVSVVTNISDTETPDEHEGPHSSESGPPTPPKSNSGPSSDITVASNGIEHPRATFIRTDKAEMIRYRYPTPKGVKLGEIVLRGPDSEKTKPDTKPTN